MLRSTLCMCWFVWRLQLVLELALVDRLDWASVLCVCHATTDVLHEVEDLHMAHTHTHMHTSRAKLYRHSMPEAHVAVNAHTHSKSLVVLVQQGHVTQACLVYPRTCLSVTLMGLVMTNQSTPSEQGGVVSEPA